MSTVATETRLTGSPGPVALGPAIVSLDRVSKWFGTVIGVNEVSLEVRPGIVALLGPNGAGKSTLMKLITGQLRPNIGRVRLFGRSVRSATAVGRMGYCPDVDAFYEEMSGRTFVETMLRLSGFRSCEVKTRTDAALATVGMSDRGDRPLRGCSKGMRQRIKLAQAIAHDPELLILDEPLTGLDPVGRREFCVLFRALAEQGKTLLVSSHVIHEVEAIADSVLLMGGGRLLTQGSWSQVAEFLNAIPQRVRIGSGDIRRLAGRLVAWPGVSTIEIRGESEGIVTTTDPRGLCERVGELVCEEGYRVDRLRSDSNWAETLFGMAKEA